MGQATPNQEKCEDYYVWYRDLEDVIPLSAKITLRSIFPKLEEGGDIILFPSN
jgi:hypothetical protein